MSVAILEGQSLQVQYQGQTVLDVPHVVVQEGEVLAVIGPNGAGKSTLLRVLGLLEAPTAGTVLYRGEPASPSGSQGLAIRRRFASVFQEPLLCDTTVRANAALGLRLRGRPATEVENRVQTWLERLGIVHLATRQARSLSGGEAQRTSLARAFAIGPDVLLLDEPFAALDPPTREELIALLQALLRSDGLTTIFVTHDRNEAIRLGDRIAVMIDGRLIQAGPPLEVFGRPATEEIARFVGIETILPGRVTKEQNGLLTVETNGVKIEALGEVAVGERVFVCLRPEDVAIRRLDARSILDSVRNHLPGRVEDATPLGPQYRVRVSCGLPVIALVTKQSYDELALERGTPVMVSFKASAIHLIRR
jgi:tungstate transport system ATP-binding protein